MARLRAHDRHARRDRWRAATPAWAVLLGIVLALVLLQYWRLESRVDRACGAALGLHARYDPGVADRAWRPLQKLCPDYDLGGS